MPSLKKLHEELEALKKEILEGGKIHREAADTETEKPKSDQKPQEAFEYQISVLNKLVKTMLDEAETTIANHPVATVAGALALGITIGRLTAR
jgi:ElaB/YqjD/DUF883 family membrane-anchored ribosome-binding protein